MTVGRRRVGQKRLHAEDLLNFEIAFLRQRCAVPNCRLASTLELPLIEMAIPIFLRLAAAAVKRESRPFVVPLDEIGGHRIEQ